MGHYWDVVCQTCEDAGIPNGAGMHARSHPVGMLRVIASAPALAAAARLDPAIVVDVPQSYDFTCETGNTIPASFFLKHEGHLLRPQNDYGLYHGDCREFVPCQNNCGKSSHLCQLSEKHIEFCKPKACSGLTGQLSVDKMVVPPGLMLIGMATQHRNGKWQSLANVNGALCVVELTVTIGNEVTHG